MYQDPLPFSPETPAANNEKTATLWRRHPATPRQKKLARTRNPRLTQADLLIEMLRAARTANQPLELPTIMAAGIAQHGARLNEVRARGFEVVNELLRDSGGDVHSRYYLRFDPEQEKR